MEITEQFVVQEHVKPAVLRRVHHSQFGGIPGSSTTHALISMFHNWNCTLDGTGDCVRIFVVDYRTALDCSLSLQQAAN